MFRLVETIRIEDGVPVNLDCHRSRMERSLAQIMPGAPVPDLESLLDVPEALRLGRVKCRFLYAPASGAEAFSAEYSAYRPRPVRRLKLVSAAPEYSLKYCDRTALERLRLSAGPCDEILIVRDGMITDTSFTNIVFRRDGRWFTPETPLLPGTARAALLAGGVISSEPIAASELGRFDGFRLINAMLPFSEQPILPMEAIEE